MSNKHPHDAVIRAWLDGKTIQLWSQVERKWKDISALEEGWNRYFSTDAQYRIKPTVVKYRRYIYTSEEKPAISLVSQFSIPEYIEAYPQFVRWIDTDWQEEEV